MSKSKIKKFLNQIGPIRPLAIKSLDHHDIVLYSRSNIYRVTKLSPRAVPEIISPEPTYKSSFAKLVLPQIEINLGLFILSKY